MIHFVFNLHNYMMFEVVMQTTSESQCFRVNVEAAQVLETSWGELVQSMRAAEDLDMLLIAHQKYLNGILTKVSCG